MKYISFTFDDGRKDNYTNAYPIMQRYKLTGTLYCTTGYIDGTWENSSKWYSSQAALSLAEIRQLYQLGWEIGLHGDKHTTSVEDLKIAYQKILSWGIKQDKFGFSIPNSSIDPKILNQVIQQCLGKEISYIRTGRKIDTSTINAKILFGLYRYVGIQWAYNKFNSRNINSLKSIQKTNIYSLVIRWEDKQKMLEKFINQMPDNSWAILMFHSILPETHPLYGSDPWNWSEHKFDTFCHYTANEQKAKRVRVLPVNEVLSIVDKNRGNYV